MRIWLGWLQWWWWCWQWWWQITDKDCRKMQSGGGWHQWILITTPQAPHQQSYRNSPTGCHLEDVALVEFMYLYLFTCQVSITIAIWVFVVFLQCLFSANQRPLFLDVVTLATFFTKLHVGFRLSCQLTLLPTVYSHGHQRSPDTRVL